MFVSSVGSGVKTDPVQSCLRSWIGLGTNFFDQFRYPKFFGPVRIGLRVSGPRDRTIIEIKKETKTTAGEDTYAGMLRAPRASSPAIVFVFF